MSKISVVSFLKMVQQFLKVTIFMQLIAHLVLVITECVSNL